jgi:hypothetical protein
MEKKGKENNREWRKNEKQIKLKRKKNKTKKE